MKTINQIVLVLLFFFVANPAFAQIKNSNANVATVSTEEQAIKDAVANIQEENTNTNETESNASTQQARELIETEQRSKVTEQEIGRNTETEKDNNSIVNEIISEANSPVINIRHTVQLVPQQTDVSCWAASAAMVVGWRDNISIDPSEIANGGPWSRYYKNGGLPADNVNMLHYWGLELLPNQTRTVEGFAQILEPSPLWVATNGGTSGHIIVVAGMRGDGSPDGTLLTIYDPWERGMRTFRPSNRGSIYTETYTQFVARQEVLANREMNVANPVYIAR